MMPPKISLLIRADASSEIGSGHVMRCMALALTARAQNIPVSMICRCTLPWVSERLATAGVNVCMLEGAPAQREDPHTLLQHLEQAAPTVSPDQCWVIMDGYHFDLESQKAVRKTGYKLLLVDDYAHLPEYECDILLNQNFGAEKIHYHGNIGKKLLGLRYALLRPEFAEARAQALNKTCPQAPSKLLLSLGGGDSAAPLQDIARHFRIPAMAGKVLRVIAGSMTDEAIQQCLRHCPADIEILHDVKDMPALLLDTDLCITAGGSTCWELCCLGVPFIVFPIAKNQEALSHELLAQRYAYPLENEHALTCYSPSLLEDRARLCDLVDGRGALRVCLQCVHGSVLIRQASEADRDFIWEVISSPGIATCGRNAANFTYEKHIVWFSQKIHDSNVLLSIILDMAQKPCGWIRFDCTGNCAVASLAIVSQYEGLGLAKRAFQAACAQVRQQKSVEIVRAVVRSDNIKSQRFFTAAGFVKSHNQQDAECELITYVLHQ